MLPAAHLIPCQILDTEPHDGKPAVRLQCHQELLPLPESGPGYVVFQPIPELPESPDEIDWTALLTQGLHREEWWIPRSSILRTLTPEGLLAAFRMGDPFDLSPQNHEVEWTDGDVVSLRLMQPLRLPELLGPEPPPWPTFPMIRVEYELPSPEALRDFPAGAVEVSPDHWRYCCWALEVFGSSYEADPPRLPHQSAIDEPFDAVESWLVLDEAPIARARESGWSYAGRLWLNPLSGALSDGAIFGQLRALEGRVRAESFSFLHLGQALTALVPFDFAFHNPTEFTQRWSSNLPFPVLPEDG